MRNGRGGTSVARLIALALLVSACSVAPALHAELWVTSISSTAGPAPILRYETTTGAFLGKLSNHIGDQDWESGSTALGPDGYVYVANSGGVARFDTSGRFVDIFSPPFPSGGDQGPRGPNYLAFGPDGDLFVVLSGGITRPAQVFRYDGVTGAFKGIALQEGYDGLNGISGIVFGPDGNLYVASANTDQVFRFDGATGHFLGIFVQAGSGGLDFPSNPVFTPNHDLLVGGIGKIFLYRGTDGAPLGTIITYGASNYAPMAIGPDGLLYLGRPKQSDILRYDPATGVFMGTFVAPNSGGLDVPFGLLFTPDPPPPPPDSGPRGAGSDSLARPRP